MDKEKPSRSKKNSFPKDKEKPLTSAESSSSSVSSGLSQGDAFSQNFKHTCNSFNTCTTASIIKISLCIRLPNQKKDTKEENNEAVASKISQENTKSNAAPCCRVETPTIACRSIAVNLKPDSSEEEDDDMGELNGSKGALKEVVVPLIEDKLHQSIFPERNQLVYRAYLPWPFELPDEIQRNKNSQAVDLWKRLIELEKQVEKLPGLKSEIILLRKENKLLKIELMSHKSPNLRSIGIGESSLFDIPSITLPSDDSKCISDPTEQDVQTIEDSPDGGQLETSMACCELSCDATENGACVSHASETESLSVLSKADQQADTVCDNKSSTCLEKQIETEYHSTADDSPESFSSEQLRFVSWMHNGPTKGIRCPSIPDMTRRLLNSSDVKPHTSPQTMHSISTQTTESPSLLSGDICEEHNVAVQSLQASHTQTQCSEFVNDQVDVRMLNSHYFTMNENLVRHERNEINCLKDCRNGNFRENKPRKEAVVRPIPRTPLSEEMLYTNNDINARPILGSLDVSSSNGSERQEYDSARDDSSSSQCSSSDDVLEIPTRSIFFYTSANQLPELERLIQSQRSPRFVKLCRKCYHSLKNATKSTYGVSEAHGIQRVSATKACQTVPEETFTYSRNVLIPEPDSSVESDNNSCQLQIDAAAIDEKEQCNRTASISSELLLSQAQSTRRLSRSDTPPGRRFSKRRFLRLHTFGRTLPTNSDETFEVEDDDKTQNVILNDSNNLFKCSSKQNASCPCSQINGSQTFENSFTDAPDEISSKEAGLKLECHKTQSEKPKFDGIPEGFVDTCKVINSYLVDLEKERDKSLRGPILIVQEKWLEVAGSKASSPYLVSKYIQFFKSLSKEMLHWVVNCVDPDGNTVLNFALANSNFEVVKVLLETGFCDLDKPNKVGHTPIIICASSRPETDAALHTVKTMLKMGNINFKSLQCGQTALMTAVSYGSTAMVRLLLEAGVDVNAQDDDGSTALMFAAERGDIECTKLLLNNPKCDPHVKDNNGINACTIALNAGHSNVGLLIYARTTNSKLPSKLKRKKKTWKV